MDEKRLAELEAEARFGLPLAESLELVAEVRRLRDVLRALVVYEDLTSDEPTGPVCPDGPHCWADDPTGHFTGHHAECRRANLLLGWKPVA